MARVIIGILLSVLVIHFYFRRRIQALPGVRITSAFRNPWKNEEVGGVLNSRHQVGMAFDVVPATLTTIQALRRIGFKKILDEGDHIHVEII